MESSSCCVPAPAGAVAVAGPPPRRGRSAAPRGQLIPGGDFLMGDAFDEGYAADGERPVHQVSLGAFRLDATTVTNAAFAAFVKETGHVTTAEQAGSSAVFHLAYDGDGTDVLGRPEQAPWWLGVAGADWRHPEGRASDVLQRQNHPVVHVSHDDAIAYAAWVGGRLPTEAEWEYAARGGLDQARFPWGDDRGDERGRWRLNIFQGEFPQTNTAEDGWVTTAPARSYQPNGYGLYQVVGNVWEWCSDWFDPDYYAASPETEPLGPEGGISRVMRGGSFLCHDSYCRRYRVSARSSSPPDSSASNLGFRCASDA